MSAGAWPRENPDIRVPLLDRFAAYRLGSVIGRSIIPRLVLCHEGSGFGSMYIGVIGEFGETRCAKSGREIE